MNKTISKVLKCHYETTMRNVFMLIRMQVMLMQNAEINIFFKVF